MEYAHKPVMLEECIEALRIKPEGVYLDGTAGLGGHSRAIADKLTKGRLICMDKDAEALQYCKNRLAGFPVAFVHDDFRNMGQALNGLGIKQVDGILLDLGVSSLQLDKPERGFSYKYDAPLDMRMNTYEEASAADIVNTWDRDEIKRILYSFGEERYAPQIASAIVKARPVTSTGQLARVVAGAMPGKGRKEAQHPARRTFQAIRMAVNDELRAVEEGITAGLRRLSPGARLLVITFHSLEDRLVKNLFRQAQLTCACPPDFPVCVCGGKKEFSLVGNITPGERELEENPRAASARLRVVEKIA